MKNHFQYFPKIGMRNIKTAIAVLVCLVVSERIDGIAPFYACIAAVMSMKEDYTGSWTYGKQRLAGTLVGGILGIFILLIEEYLFSGRGEMIFLPISIILSIYLSNLLFKKDSVSISCIVLLAVTLNHNGDAEKYIYAATRIIETFIGVIAALLVNRYVFPIKKVENDSRKA